MCSHIYNTYTYTTYSDANKYSRTENIPNWLNECILAYMFTVQKKMIHTHSQNNTFFVVHGYIDSKYSKSICEFFFLHFAHSIFFVYLYNVHIDWESIMCDSVQNDSKVISYIHNRMCLLKAVWYWLLLK